MGECVLDIINIDKDMVFVHHPTMSMAAASMSCIESHLAKYPNTSSIETSYVYDVLCSVNIDACIWDGFTDDEVCVLTLDIPSAQNVKLSMWISPTQNCLFYTDNMW